MHHWPSVICAVATAILLPSLSHQCDSIAFFKERGFALEGHVINSSYLHPDDCLWRCKANVKCFSINVKKVKPGTYLCEFNNSTKDAAPESLHEKLGFEYRGFMLGNHSGSSTYFSRASELPFYPISYSVYPCATTCLFPDGWYFQRDSLYKYFSLYKTWLEANAFCQSIGAELASVSEQEQNEFVYRNLLPKQDDGCKTNHDLIGCWLLDGTEPEVILRNGASYKNTDNINALFLDGSGAYADTPAVSLQFPAITITCWLKVLEPAKTPGYVCADWSSPHQFALWVHGKWKNLWFQSRNKFAKDVLTIYAAISYNVWIHAAVTWDQGSKIARIFINGQQINSKPARTGLSGYEFMANSHSFYQVGCKLDTSETFHGFVRDVKVFKGLLRNSEIQQEAARTPQTNQSGVWLGLNDRSLEGTFVWNNKLPVKFTNWIDGQPSSQSADQDCVVMDTGNGIYTGKWMTKRCDEKNHFVCRKAMT